MRANVPPTENAGPLPAAELLGELDSPGEVSACHSVSGEGDTERIFFVDAAGASAHQLL